MVSALYFLAYTLYPSPHYIISVLHKSVAFPEAGVSTAPHHTHESRILCSFGGALWVMFVHPHGTSWPLIWLIILVQIILWEYSHIFRWGNLKIPVYGQSSQFSLRDGPPWHCLHCTEKFTSNKGQLTSVVNATDTLAHCWKCPQQIVAKLNLLH